ncbi:Ketosteroid isomerase-related protein [Epibacterium ulvae]|uniref:Ketosteroid isomerase-related protein n=1 Tax=Epibacterium ulvae TaxID=1156985 RepID=A0A1G5QNP0_9RHOB|nr:SnoaL-like domain-containing protein [Epibacterium ulvae]SCZ63465.1 Ketosteroid isomerase-related protein [Epibacterium ulvae]
MTLKEIADKLVAGCREGQEKENLSVLYAADAVSVEAADTQGMGREVTGIDAIRGKHEWWESAFEVSEHSLEGPFLHGDDRFGVIFAVKGKEKSTGQDFDMREVAIYHVANGKIVREEFFY